MLEEKNIQRLRRYGITEKYVELFTKGLTDYLETAKPKKITKPTIIFSDLHGNYPALQMVMSFAEEHKIDNFISLGDLIEYNPQNDEVLDLIHTNKDQFIINLKGNHDEGKIRDEDFISTIFQYTIRKDLGEYLVGLLKNGFIEVNDKNIFLCHSNPWNLDILYLFEEETNFFDHFLEVMNCDGFMFGHTHHVTFYQSTNNKFIFNPGSLGVSRDGKHQLYFTVLEPDISKLNIYKIQHKELNYLALEDNKPQKIKEYIF